VSNYFKKSPDLYIFKKKFKPKIYQMIKDTLHTYLGLGFIGWINFPLDDHRVSYKPKFHFLSLKCVAKI
jgi:hypothetical protein